MAAAKKSAVIPKHHLRYRPSAKRARPAHRTKFVHPRAWTLGAVFGASAMLGGSCTGDQHERMQVRHDDCYTCHQPEYEATAMPAHVGLYPTACGNCHSNVAWIPAVAQNHDQFPLNNRHAEIACSSCHTVGFGPGETPNTCVGCHRANYDTATMPPHAGYPTDCASCHDDAGWSPSTFVHPWPLDGAHATTSCFTCHTGDPPQYAGVPRQCVGCHQSDYDTSPYPGHSAFPTACQDCHTTNAWRPALEGAHPEGQFPINAGPHGDVGCTECHDPARGSSAMGMNTNCTGCHEHRLDRSREQHLEVNTYPASPTTANFCLDCHPNGRN